MRTIATLASHGRQVEICMASNEADAMPEHPRASPSIPEHPRASPSIPESIPERIGYANEVPGAKKSEHVLVLTNDVCGEKKWNRITK